MGRKIPGKKHRGIKDPDAQRAKREAILKPKLNSLPKDLDSQEVPKKLLELMKFKESSNANQSNKKAPRQKGPKLLDSTKHMGYEMRLPGMKKPLRPIPVFQQHPGEPVRKFLGRMECQVKDFLKRRNYETKNNIELVEDAVTGRPKFIAAEKDELDEELDQKKRHQLAKRGIVVKSKEEKRQLRRQKEKERKRKKKKPRDNNKKEDEFQDFETSKPSFNDVAHQPPTLCLPRGVTATEKRRPGAKSHLLLKDKLGIKNNSNSKIEKKKIKPEMSLATKERLRIERERVIEQYRKLKASKSFNKF